MRAQAFEVLPAGMELLELARSLLHLDPRQRATASEAASSRFVRAACKLGSDA
jgi:hypothetical protein